MIRLALCLVLLVASVGIQVAGVAAMLAGSLATGGVFLTVALLSGLGLLLWRAVTSVIKPGVVSVVVGVAGLFVAVLTAYLMVGSLLTVGTVEARRIESELRDLIEQHRGVAVLGRDQEPLGLVPAVYTKDKADAGFLTRPMAPGDVPPIFWECVKFLEDRGIGEPWHIMGVDFYRLGRAVTSNAFGDRKGASTVAEMIQRSIRSQAPDPSASWTTELSRKILSWRDLPAIVLHVFPDEDALKSAAATYLPLMIGAPGSRFGGEIHGVVLAARMLGKAPAELSAAEQALLAAAIKRPLRIGGSDDLSWERARLRAHYCLEHAPLEPIADRKAAQEALASLTAPNGPLVHPAIVLQRRMGGAVAEITRQVATELGPDWRKRVDAVHVSVPSSSDDLVRRLRETSQVLQTRLKGDLWVPLWSGDNAAWIYGVVADAQGHVLASVSNAEFDPSRIRLPIGSVAKIVAALALGNTDRATLNMQAAFARSEGALIQRRLGKIPGERVSEVFQALGWTNPDVVRISRRHAIYGHLEVTPVDVLRGLMAIHELLANETPETVSAPRLVRTVDLVDGTSLTAASDPLPLAPLLTFFTDRSRHYIQTVLAAPLTKAQGTMKPIGDHLRTEGAGNMWGKSGTADVSTGGRNVSPTRAIWQTGGFSIGGRRLTFLMMAASRDGARPLGFVQSPDLSPLTLELLKSAITQTRAQKS